MDQKLVMVAIVTLFDIKLDCYLRVWIIFIIFFITSNN